MQLAHLIAGKIPNGIFSIPPILDKPVPSGLHQVPLQYFHDDVLRSCTTLQAFQNILTASVLMDTFVVQIQPLWCLRRSRNPFQKQLVVSIHTVLLKIPLLKLRGSQFLHVIP